MLFPNMKGVFVHWILTNQKVLLNKKKKSTYDFSIDINNCTVIIILVLFVMANGARAQ